MDDLEGALQDLSHAAQLCTPDAYGLRRRGNVHRSLAMWHVALTDLNKAADLEAEDPHWQTLLLRGEMKCRLGDVAGARADLLRTLNMQPGNPDVLHYLAEAELAGGKSASALHYVRRAEQLDPNNKYRTWLLARTLVAAGSYEEGLTALDGILKQPSTRGLLYIMVHKLRARCFQNLDNIAGKEEATRMVLHAEAWLKVRGREYIAAERARIRVYIWPDPPFPTDYVD